MDTIPKEVAEAISAVMASMDKLPKGERNNHGGYDFASIDAFLAAMNPICAKAGLFILQNEEDVEVMPPENGKKVGTLRAVFSHTLCHKSGASAPPVRRSVMVQATGAQAFGSAQSYALKQFLRSTFMVATGDKDDPDFQKGEDLPTKSSAQAKRDGDFEAIKKELDAASTLKELAAVWKDVQPRLRVLKESWREAITDYKDACKKALETPAPLDPETWLSGFGDRVTACKSAEDLNDLNESVSQVLVQYPDNIQKRANELVLDAAKSLTLEPA